MHHYFKFHRNQSNDFWDTAIVFDFQYGCRLPSSKFLNLRILLADVVQISSKSLNPWQTYRYFSIFFSKWWLYTILDFQNLNVLPHSVLMAIVHQSTKFTQNRSNLLLDIVIFNFQNGDSPPSWILKCLDNG